jgi:lipoprotein-releasing system ATP-binding protein
MERSIEEPTLSSTPAPSSALLSAEGIHRSFTMGERSLEILHGVDLQLHRGELVALLGSSGAGKSTLLHILGMLDRPTAGSVLFEGKDAWEFSITRRAALRNQHVGFVFQFYHLLTELTALENVLLPVMIAESRLRYRSRRKQHQERGRELLDRFGMGSRLKHRPPQLSGGERQRVAMARALFNDPEILLADEPTGNLDRATGEKVLDLLLEEQRRSGLSMILVTHDERIASRCGRSLTMEDGLLVSPPQ